MEIKKQNFVSAQNTDAKGFRGTNKSWVHIKVLYERQLLRCHVRARTKY